MFKIVTKTGQTLNEYFLHIIPSECSSELKTKLKVLKQFGSKCIGSFVIKRNDKFCMFLISESIPPQIIVYLEFVGENVIICDVENRVK